MSTLVDDWLTYLRVDRGLSKNTLATYARTLRTLPNPKDATREDLDKWWRDRATGDDGAQRPVSSRLNELSAVRAFYRWCQIFEHRLDDPTVRITPLRKPHKESRFVGREDLDRLLATLPPDLRRAVALGAYGGLRVSEAAGLEWSDIDLDSRRAIIRGKGGKERRIGFTPTLLDFILPECQGNVVRAGGKPFSGHTLQQKVNAAIRDAGVDATFHNLRHRFGFKAAEAGVPPTSIARAMGHASLSTTMGYIAAVDSDLDLIAEAVTR